MESLIWEGIKTYSFSGVVDVIVNNVTGVFENFNVLVQFGNLSKRAASMAFRGVDKICQYHNL